MKAVISMYKSEALDYLRKNNILQEDAILICSEADFEAAKGKAESVVLLSAPLGVPMDSEYLEFALTVKTDGPPEAPEPIGEKEPVIETPIVEEKEEEVKEIEAPSESSKEDPLGKLKEAVSAAKPKEEEDVMAELKTAAQKHEGLGDSGGPANFDKLHKAAITAPKKVSKTKVAVDRGGKPLKSKTPKSKKL